MYDGWQCLIQPVIFSGIITLAVWTLPHLRKQGNGSSVRQRRRVPSLIR